MDFIVLGLPRSGTTWLANWLTTEKSLCLHDPFALGLPEAWPRDDRRLGISCTGAYLFPKWLSQQECPIAIIVRDADACDASLQALGFGTTFPFRNAFHAVEGRRFSFESLWIENDARTLWDFLLPRMPFDALRYRQLKDMQIQPHMGKWKFDPTVFQAMQRREAGGLRCLG